MHEQYTLPSQDVRNQAQTLALQGDPNNYSRITYTIPGVTCAFQPVYIRFIPSRRADGEMRGQFLVQSKVEGGSSFDPSPIIDRPATIGETAFMASLLIERLPNLAVDIKKIAREQINTALEKAQKAVTTTQADLTNATASHESAKQNLKQATAEAKQALNKLR